MPDGYENAKHTKRGRKISLKNGVASYKLVLISYFINGDFGGQSEYFKCQKCKPWLW